MCLWLGLFFCVPICLCTKRVIQLHTHTNHTCEFTPLGELAVTHIDEYTCCKFLLLVKLKLYNIIDSQIYRILINVDFCNSYVLPTGGYNVKDVVFYWTRGNLSVSGLDTLQLAQYTLEDYYTSESEAVYETGMFLLSHTVDTNQLIHLQ